MANSDPSTHYNPQLPANIEQAILTSLSKDRTKRHSDVSAFIRALIKPPLATTLLTYRGHTAGVNAISWSPDGKRIASSSFGVNVWQAE